MTAAGVNLVLPEHRVIFESYLAKWQELLGLTNWRIKLSAKRPPKAMYADVVCHYRHKQATVRLGDDLGANTPVTPETLEAIAVHELCHVLLHEPVHAGIEDEETLAAAEHSVIHVLQKLLTKGRI